MPHVDAAARKASKARYRAENPEKMKTYQVRYRAKNPAKMKAYQARYRAKNAEKRKAYNVRYRAEHPEKVKAYQTRYRVEHNEKERARHVRYCAEHPEKVKASSARYRAEHPDKRKADSAKRRARKLSAGGRGITARQWQEVMDSSLGLCTYCNERRPLALDHIVPLSGGGEHDIENAVPACQSCNGSKHKAPMLLWLARRAA